MLEPGAGPLLVLEACHLKLIGGQLLKLGAAALLLALQEVIRRLPLGVFFSSVGQLFVFPGCCKLQTSVHWLVVATIAVEPCRYSFVSDGKVNLRWVLFSQWFGILRFLADFECFLRGFDFRMRGEVEFEMLVASILVLDLVEESRIVSLVAAGDSGGGDGW